MQTRSQKRKRMQAEAYYWHGHEHLQEREKISSLLLLLFVKFFFLSKDLALRNLANGPCVDRLPYVLNCNDVFEIRMTHTKTRGLARVAT